MQNYKASSNTHFKKEFKDAKIASNKQKMDVTHKYFEIAFLNFAKFLLDPLDLLADLKIVSNGHEL